MAEVRIPTAMRPLAGGSATVDIEGETVRVILDELVARYPPVRERLFDDAGALRRFVNIYVGEEDIRFVDGLDTEVGPGQTVSLLPAVAGG